MTGELLVVLMMGKWSKNVVDIFRMYDYMRVETLFLSRNVDAALRSVIMVTGWDHTILG